MAEYISSVTKGTVWFNPKLNEIGVWDSQRHGMWNRTSGFKGHGVHTGPWQWYDSRTDKQVKRPTRVGWVKIGKL